MSKYNLKACMAYNFTEKSEPAFIYYNLIILPSDLDPGTTSPFDENNHQYYKGGSQGGIFTINRIGLARQEEIYSEYLHYCEVCGLTPRPERWTYESNACNSYKWFRINIYKPGRAMMKCTIPQLGCASGWFYYSENKGDFDKPWRMYIDKVASPREIYWELDIFETFRELFGTRVACSGHWGTQRERDMSTAGILSRFDEPVYPEVVWDGQGNWKWFLSGIPIHEAFIPQPEIRIYPFFKCTYAVMEEFPKRFNTCSWAVDWVKFSNIILIQPR